MQSELVSRRHKLDFAPTRRWTTKTGPRKKTRQCDGVSIGRYYKSHNENSAIWQSAREINFLRRSIFRYPLLNLFVYFCFQNTWGNSAVGCCIIGHCTWTARGTPYTSERCKYSYLFLPTPSFFPSRNKIARQKSLDKSCASVAGRRELRWNTCPVYLRVCVTCLEQIFLILAIKILHCVPL